MLKQVRFVAFNRPIDLPLRPQADNATTYDPEVRDGVGYNLAFDTELRQLRVEVPKHKISQAVGVGILGGGNPWRPVYGKEAVQHVPESSCSRIVYMDENLPEPKNPQAQAKK